MSKPTGQISGFNYVSTGCAVMAVVLSVAFGIGVLRQSSAAVASARSGVAILTVRQMAYQMELLKSESGTYPQGAFNGRDLDRLVGSAPSSLSGRTASSYRVISSGNSFIIESDAGLRRYTSKTDAISF